MQQILDTILNTPSYILIAITLVIVIIFARKTMRILRKFASIAFSILTIFKLLHMLNLMDILK
ncbi:hypothetical protein AWU65_03080 [Paenibacillus glucanolyticus]|uniref:Uncharacterized protein n=1 Tax=Paenibacillus glucanolyticus TaxID=59843 RepID=A0A163GHM5_9BACL|nr:hypothetical protein AWU65_03080 [Paenibacillus glucanolyticus]OMF64809.1 hypothetical protein BK142_31430 [Paenibacillus glucanolyticus]